MSQLIISQGELFQVGIVLGKKEYLNGFFPQDNGVYSYDGLLLMLVLIVKYIADMGFLQGD